ncbi:MAG: ribosome small subunit-dependent GTPase A [Sulfobacillus sp.]
MFQWGWNGDWQRKLEEGRYTGIPARIVQAHQDIYRVVSEAGEGLAGLAGKLRYQVQRFPVVGDFVVGRPGSRFLIEGILPPDSTIVRQAAGTGQAPQAIASNVDVTFIVEAMDQVINPRRIERYLTMARQGNSHPVILLTKSDMVVDPFSTVSDIRSIDPEVPAYAVSAMADDGTASIGQHLRPGATGVFLGMSGAGKSTLINSLLGDSIQRTGDVRSSDHRGRHTTTARTLFLLPSGAMIIDTPGMRELGLWGAENSIDDTFWDVVDWTDHCRFGNCTHQTEPGCMVLYAIETGQLEKSRYLGYQKLQKEAAHQARKGDPALQSQAREHWKKASAQGRANRQAKLHRFDRT